MGQSGERRLTAQGEIRPGVFLDPASGQITSENPSKNPISLPQNVTNVNPASPESLDTLIVPRDGHKFGRRYFLGIAAYSGLVLAVPGTIVGMAISQQRSNDELERKRQDLIGKYLDWDNNIVDNPVINKFTLDTQSTAPMQYFQRPYYSSSPFPIRSMPESITGARIFADGPNQVTINDKPFEMGVFLKIEGKFAYGCSFVKLMNRDGQNVNLQNQPFESGELPILIPQFYFRERR